MTNRAHDAAPGFQCALLVRRSIAKPTELTFYLTHAPKGTSLARLVRVCAGPLKACSNNPKARSAWINTVKRRETD